MERPGPGSLVRAPGTGSLHPNCTRAIRWPCPTGGLFSGGPLGPLRPAALRRPPTSQDPRREEGSGPHHSPTRRPSGPATAQVLPTSWLPFSLHPQRHGRGSAVAPPPGYRMLPSPAPVGSEGPQGLPPTPGRATSEQLETRGAWQPEVAPTSTTHTPPSLGAAPSTAAPAILSNWRPSVWRLSFTHNTAAESGPESRSQWFCGARLGSRWVPPEHRARGLAGPLPGQLVTADRLSALGERPPLPPRSGASGLRESLLL